MGSDFLIRHKPDGFIRVGVVSLSSKSRDTVVSDLARRAAELLHGAIDRETIQERVATRELLATSAVAEDIAFPHAIVPGIHENVVVLGYSSEGIDWDPAHLDIRLVVLFAGGETDHLHAMATMARVLQSPQVRERVWTAASPEQVRRILADERDHELSPSALRFAAETLAREIPDAVTAVVASTYPDGRLPGGPEEWLGWYILDGPDASGTPRVFDEVNAGSVEREVARAAVEGLFGDAPAIVALWGDRGSSRLNTIRIVSIDRHQAESRFPDFHPLVVHRVERLARTIAMEGREGKRVGCFFVIADPGEIASMTHQLIVNPFQGYPREARNILDPSLEETIKEFSKIDGAFVISGDGTVESAGTYIAVKPHALDHHPGEGTRHASARAVTAVIQAVAIVVSESTGRVSVYTDGKRAG